MLKTGHEGAALLLYAPVGYLLVGVDPLLAGIGLVGTVSLAMLPDVDMRIPFVPHRGPTHTLVFVGCATIVVATAGYAAAVDLGLDPIPLATVGVVVGVTAVGSHLLADALTPSGVPFLWPLSDRRFSLGIVRADNPIANGLLFVLGVAATGGFAHAAGVI